MDLDFKAYFDTIPHDKLMARVEDLISDGRLLALLRAVSEGRGNGRIKGMGADRAGHAARSGHQPALANLYLNPLDHLMAAPGYDMTRYADDLVVQCRSQAEAKAALESDTTVGARERADGASDQNTNRGCDAERRI